MIILLSRSFFAVLYAFDLEVLTMKKVAVIMGSISDLVASPDYLYEVVLEDANASELWAKEIIVSEFIF